MSADNSHAERKILARIVRWYDAWMSRGVEDYRARKAANYYLARYLRIDRDKAAELLADALARRASLKLGGTEG